MTAIAHCLEAAETKVERGLASIDFGAAAMALVHGDDTRVRAWGEAAPGAPMSSATPMHICSCTKAFTAYLCGRVLDWGAPIQNLIPEFDLGDAWLNTHCQLRDLAAMRVGLSREGVPEWGVDARMDVRERLARARHMKRIAPFRERFAYSNLSYVALGLAAARAHACDLPILFEREIARPLGLKHADFGADATNPSAARPHLLIDGRVAPVRELTGPSSYGSAGLLLSAEDAVVWLQQLCAAARGDARAGLDGAIVRQMMAPQNAISQTDGPLDAHVEAQAYGYGIFVGKWRGRRLVRHGGGGRGLRAAFALAPDEGLGIMLMASCEAPDLEGVALEALAVLLGDEADFAASYRAHASRAAGAAWASWKAGAAASEGALTEGRFHNGATGSVTISQESDHMRIAFADAPMFDARLIAVENIGFQLSFDEPALSRQDLDPPLCLRVRADGALVTSYWGVLERAS
jgi:CubicO group peptidase (beta-lactamase class C family)